MTLSGTPVSLRTGGVQYVDSTARDLMPLSVIDSYRGVSVLALCVRYITYSQRIGFNRMIFTL